MRIAGALREQLVVVPHGVDLELFTLGKDEIDSNRLLFVSKPWDYKGLATVLRAIALIADNEPASGVHLRVADGGLSVQERHSWRAFVEGLGIAQRVSFLGRVDHASLADEYRSACALVLPTSIESFGNAFLEAAACGCPIVTGTGHGIEESIGPVAEQIPPHRHDVLAAVTLRLIRLSERERFEKRRELRSWAERFPWSRVVADTRTVLKEALA
jgi:glycosyltransferase involved in cell wall biosynthesis